MNKNKKNGGGKPQSQRKKYNFVLDLLLDVHKRTGLTCQSQISRQQQRVFLSKPGSQGPRDLFRTKTWLRTFSYLITSSLWSPAETVYHRLGLEPMWWDLNPPKTQFGTQTHVARSRTQLKPTVPGFRTSWSSGSWSFITERIQWETKW